MTLWEKIQDAINTDDEDTNDISRDLEDMYNNGSDEVRKTLDSAFTILCGYTLKTLIEESEEPEDEEDE